MNKIIAVGFMIFALTITGCNKKADENKTTEDLGNYAPNGKGAVEKQAPDFTLTSTDGKNIKLSDYKGKIIIVDFWATWCPPCKRGIPDLIEIQNEYKNDVVVIGISVDSDTKNNVEPFMQSIGINYPVVYANSEVVQAYGGIESIPTSFIIDQKGNIVDQHTGLVPKAEFTTVLKKLLSKS
jgi:peroxiredoxin